MPWESVIQGCYGVFHENHSIWCKNVFWGWIQGEQGRQGFSKSLSLSLTVCPHFLLVIVWWHCVSCHRTHWPLSLLVCRELDGLLGTWLWHPQLGGLGKVYLVSGLQRWPILQCPAWCRAALAKVWRCCPAGGSLSLRFVSQLPFPNPQPGSQLTGSSPLAKACCHQMALHASLGGFCKDHDCFLWHWPRVMGIQHTCLNFWFFISLIAVITHEHIFVSYTDNLNIEVFFLVMLAH